MLSRPIGIITITLAASALAACSVYDPTLIPAGRDDSGAAGASGSSGFGGSGGNAGADDASMPDDDAGISLCVPNDDEFCPLSCPETCNGLDDDCDGRADEASLEPLCQLANAESVCVDAECLLVGCNTPFADCDGRADNGCEVRLDSSEHCGSCGRACDIPGATTLCIQATCVFDQCVSGFGDCDGDPTNGCELRVDTLVHCGACRVACPTSVPNGVPGCIDGACAVASCEAGFADCDGDISNGCETPNNTVTDCGVCGNACMFARATPVCDNGVCAPGECVDGFGDCDGDPSNECETTFASDTLNCGGCGRDCAQLGGSDSSYRCVDNECVVTNCPDGLADCDNNGSNGCETPLNTLTDCGGCGTVCARSNASATCESGTCELGACDPLFANCDGNPTNGCERPTNTLTDCGGCNSPCTSPTGTPSCTSGVCSLADCAAPLADCNGMIDDGCEVNTATSMTHCGACNARCGDLSGRLPNATASCESATCSIAACDSNFADCDSVASNGCETSLRTIASCGACGTVCSRANASVTCSTGSCAVSTCNAGFGNCDSFDANGCETPLNTNTDCGGCGTPCAQANATTSCASGTCQRVSCNAGFGDCDGNPANGCETALNSLTHCGACNAPCALNNASQSCATGTCALTSCNSGFGNCDSITANGCEAALTTNSNCGACGSQCDYANATESCTTGTCTLTGCSSGFGNCDSNTANGCEQSLTTLTHCGGCNVACTRANASASCGTGTCTLGACNSGFGNCDGNAANGCETPLGTTSNCSACGDVCGDGNPCENFICRGSFPYTTSNVDVTTLDYSGAPTTTLNCGTTTITTSASGATFTNWCGTPPTPLVRTQSSGPAVIVIPLQGLTVNAGNTLLLRGTQPVLLAVLGDVTVHGTIDAGAVATTVGAGGNVNCGTGGGAVGGSDNADGGGGGGGAGFGLNGATGGGGHNNSSLAFGGAGGGSHGNTSNTPLRGGCPGGRGGTGSNNTPGGGGLGGAGGGSVQISASGRVTVSATGVISASGGGGRHGSDRHGGGGGGSGGAVLVESGGVLSIAAGAWITANGGGGAGGNSSNHGADGTRNNGNRATGGTGASGGGNGGLGGASSGGATNGTNGGSNDGGGGGGGAVGRIALRGVGGCSVSGSTSPASSQSCP